MVTKKTFMKGTNQDLVFLASVSVAAAQDNADNIGKLVEDKEHYKEIMLLLENTLIKERGEGGELKRMG